MLGILVKAHLSSIHIVLINLMDLLQASILYKERFNRPTCMLPLITYAIPHTLIPPLFLYYYPDRVYLSFNKINFTLFFLLYNVHLYTQVIRNRPLLPS
jgi:hypothetical protein